jgi:hypothetical protein
MKQNLISLTKQEISAISGGENGALISSNLFIVSQKNLESMAVGGLFGVIAIIACLVLKAKGKM